MFYRALGRTGLKVSSISFGGSSLGSVFKPIEESEGIRAVHLAIDRGINLIDTAPYYGLTQAEAVLGKALREVSRDRYLLATKVGRYNDANFDFSAARVEQSLDESLRRLGVDYVDFIQVHDMEFGDLDQIVEETLPALRKAQAAGKARFIGITGLGLNLFPKVLEKAEVDLVQSYCHYCLNDSALEDLLPLFELKGIAVLNSAPLAMRLLSNEGPPAWHPAPDELKNRCSEAARFCREQGADLSKLALQFSVGHPSISSTVIGMASQEEVQRNLDAIEEPPDAHLLQEVLTILKPVHNLTWPSGRPENN